MASISRATQRQIDLTTAVCQERLLATHVRHVLAFVDLVSDRLPFDDAVDIYVRILGIPPEQARNIGSRALAQIGYRGGVPQAAARAAEQRAAQEAAGAAAEAAAVAEQRDGDDGDQNRSDAVLSRVRRRIRGRVEDDLRTRIDLATARSEDSIFETHVENALIFVRALAGEMRSPDGVELYLDTMMLPEGEGNVIYHRSLRMLADDQLPPVPGDSKPGSAA